MSTLSTYIVTKYQDILHYTQDNKSMKVDKVSKSLNILMRYTDIIPMSSYITRMQQDIRTMYSEEVLMFNYKMAKITWYKTKYQIHGRMIIDLYVDSRAALLQDQPDSTCQCHVAT